MRALVLELVRFGGVGLAATGTHALVYLVALLVAPPQVANLLGYVSAVVLSYVGHSRFTFSEVKRREEPSVGRIAKFVSVSLLGFAANAGFVALTVDVLSAPPWVAVGFIAGVTPLLTYILLKFFVFGGPARSE